MRICVGVDIDRPRGEVWALLERIEDHVRWMADAETITFRTSRHRGLGTEFECRTRVGPLRTDDLMTVVEWDEPGVIGIVHRGLVTGSGRFTLAASPAGGTRLEWQETLRFPLRVGGPLGEFVAAPVLRRIWRGNLGRFKELAEGFA